MLRPGLTVLLLAYALLPGCGGCSDPASGGGDGGVNNNNGNIPDSGWPTGDASVILPDGSVIIETDGGTVECFPTLCTDKLLECGDCLDNDLDGRVDWMDPECLGPCDNTEGPALNAGVGGETGGPCVADCYWDFGNGAGNDNCYWDHRCDPFAVAPNYYPEGEDCAYDEEMVGSRDCPEFQSQVCLDFCLPLTPNGCDCFGCCAFPELETSGPEGGQGYIWLGALDQNGNGTCTYEVILDPDACPPCTPVADCQNGCGRCEICVGKPTVPPDCYGTPDGGVPDGGVPPDGGTQCAPGIQPCGLPGQDPCQAGWYCITGCCQFAPT